MLSDILDFAINYYQGTLMILFLRFTLPKRNDDSIKTDILFSVLVGSALNLWSLKRIPLPDTVILVFVFLYPCVTHRGTVFQRLIWTVVLHATMGSVAQISTGIFTSLFHIPLSALFEPGMIRIAYVLSSNALTTFVAVLAIRISQFQNRASLGKRTLAFFFFCYFLEFFTEEILYLYQLGGNSSQSLFLLANGSLFGIMLMTLILYEMLASSVQKQLMAEAKAHIHEQDIAHQLEVEAIYHDVLRQQHDLFHQVAIVKEMLAQAHEINRDEIRGMLDIGSLADIQPSTGCVSVDALLAAKRLTMKQHHIAFIFHPYPLHDLPADHLTFCVVLSNLLDNAIEACQRITDEKTAKEICLEFARSWDMLYIRCINSMNPETLRFEKGTFFTSKKAQHTHGFGITNISDVVKKLQGTCEFTPYIDQKKFFVQLMIPLQTETEQKHESNDHGG